MLSTGLEISRKTNDSLLVSKFLNNLGLVYKNTGRLKQALEVYSGSLRLAEQFGKPDDIATRLVNIAIVQKMSGDFEKAQEFNAKAISYFEKGTNKRGLAAALNNRGLNYKELGRADSALYFFRESMELKEQINYKKGITTSLYNIGLIYADAGLSEQALDYYFRALANAQDVGAIKHIANIFKYVGNIYAGQNEYGKAIEYYQKALQINEQIGRVNEQMENHQLLSEGYTALGNYRQALTHRSEELKLKDSIFQDDVARALMSLQLDYDFESKNKEIAILKEREEKEALKNTNEKILLYGMVGFILFLLLIAFLLTRNIKRKHRINLMLEESKKEVDKQKKELELAHATIHQKNQLLEQTNIGLELNVEESTGQLNQLLKEFDQFVYKSAHDLRGPVAQLMGLCHLMKIESGNTNNPLLGRLEQTATKMDGVLARLAQIHLIRSKNILLEKVDFEEITNELSTQLKGEYPEVDIKVCNSAVDNCTIISDSELVKDLLVELMQNSVNYRNNDNPSVEIEIECSVVKGNALIKYTDNGLGVPDAFREKIFDMFYRASEASQGQGLGLYKASVIARKLSGTIKLDHTSDEGTQFIVSLPSHSQEHRD